MSYKNEDQDHMDAIALLLLMGACGFVVAFWSAVINWVLPLVPLKNIVK